MARRRTIDRGELTAIFAGGAAGALVRTGAVVALGDGAPGWPWTVFTINLTGAFVLGYLAARPAGSPRENTILAAALGTGFCGALTTFSTMMLELLTMIDRAQTGLAALYAVASIAGGLAAIVLAGRLARALESRR